MNEYQGLFKYLSNLPSSQMIETMSFKEVENNINRELPPSARKYRPWWGNEKRGTHTHRLAWMDAGWLVDKVDLIKEVVAFKRN